MPTPHIESKKEEIAKVVLMPGDPKRAEYIAKNYLDDYKLVNEVRNMIAYTGFYKGVRVTIFPSGMGIPSIGIYAYELYKFYDVETIIRIGSCGSFSKDIKLGDIILSQGAYSKTYFNNLLSNDNNNFLSSTKDLNDKIIETSKINNINLKIGPTITSDVFDLYVDNHQDFINHFQDRDYLGVEMEAFGLFYLAKKLNKKATCLMTVVDSLFDKRSMTSKEREQSLDDMIKLALESIIN